MNDTLAALHDPERQRQLAPPVRRWTGKLSVVAEPAESAARTPAGEPGTLVRRALFDRLAQAKRVTQLSAPAGSGKTLLLRSWIQQPGLSDRAAWVSVAPEERDPQRFWLSLVGALRATAVGPELVRDVSAAPGLDVWALIERLLEDLSSLEHPLWLVLDDLHELRSNDVLRQLELFLLRAPDQLRFVLMTRRDLRFGLHRLRLDGAVSEIRTADLRFSLDETRALLESAGVELSEAATALLHERTEGWAAGLRLAALSLACHPDPERFAVAFSGGERTVAEYLMAEVLERQPEEVRRLLLRTSVLERVNGPLADLLAGETDGERILQELEAASAFVVSVDARRSWFRYHHLFADLLALELRRTSPDELPALHRSAAEWYAEHGYPLEAIRHAQAGADWGLATRLLSDHWFGLYLDGQADTAHALLTGFPAAAVAADPELAALMAIFQLRRETLHVREADWYYTLAARRSRLVSTDRRVPFQILLAKVRLYKARHRGDLPTVVEEGQRLLALLEAQPGLGEEHRALALIALGSAELWAVRDEDAERHLEEGIALARRIARPWLEILGLGYSAQAASFRSTSLMMTRAEQAIALAGQHGWSEEPIVGFAYAAIAAATLWQGRLEESEALLERAERVVRPVMPWGIRLHCLRGLIELASGRDHEALSAFEAAQQLGERTVTPNQLAIQARTLQLHALLRLS